MSFTDVIKKSVLEGFHTGDLSTVSMAVTLAMAAAMGLFIYVVYRLTAKGSFYNRDFNKSLATLPVITAGILLAMQSNLVISLGMVGALSIVRFRNAVKDPADLTFLFWSGSSRFWMPAAPKSGIRINGDCSIRARIPRRTSAKA